MTRRIKVTGSKARSIKVTGSKARSIDPDKVAKALGAVKVIQSEWGRATPWPSIHTRKVKEPVSEPVKEPIKAKKPRGVMGTLPLVRRCLDLTYFHPNRAGETPIPVCFHKGHPGRLVLAIGDNASGKSFFRRVVQAVCQQNKIESLLLSMEGRGRMGPMGAFVYGDESWEATGKNSVGTVVGAIGTSRSRTNPHMIFWDEPDLGLSDSWAASVGIEISKFIREPPSYLVAAFLVTHNRELVRRLLSLQPHILMFGEKPQTIDEWMGSPITPRPLTQLATDSRRRFRLIQAILDRKKE